MYCVLPLCLCARTGVQQRLVTGQCPSPDTPFQTSKSHRRLQSQHQSPHLEPIQTHSGPTLHRYLRPFHPILICNVSVSSVTSALFLICNCISRVSSLCLPAASGRLRLGGCPSESRTRTSRGKAGRKGVFYARKKALQESKEAREQEKEQKQGTANSEQRPYRLPQSATTH